MIKKYTSIISLVVCFAGLAYLTVLGLDALKASDHQQELSEELAFCTKVNFGIFNINGWKEKALGVFSKKISSFEFSGNAYKDVEKQLRSYLFGVYEDYFVTGKLFNKIFEDAEANKTIPPFLLNGFKKTLPEQIIKLDIKSYIPQMAKTLSLELRKKEPEIKNILRAEVMKILESKDTIVIADPREPLLAKYNVTDLDSLPRAIQMQIDADKAVYKTKTKTIYIGLLGLVAFALLSFLYHRNLPIIVISISLISLVLLWLGVQLPMIVLDARLNAFGFDLFGQQLSFGEQSVFYQNKSIIDVTKTLIQGNAWDLKLVGYLVLCFSVVFPLIKLLLSGAYLSIPSFGKSNLVRGMLFHLGKWSMADVFVVAMFMAYIGFYGLVKSQLGAIDGNQSGFAVETINYTHLDMGALYFTTYCILSIILGVILSNNQKQV